MSSSSCSIRAVPSSRNRTCSRGRSMADCRSAPSRQNAASTCISAVVMRSAPGLPTARRAPSRCRAVVGAMLEASAGAGGEGVQPEPVELRLAQAVVEHQPGAGDGGTGAVAGRRGDRARRPVAVDDRHVGGRGGGGQRGEVLLGHRADEVAAGLEQVGGDVEVVPAVAEHLALDPDHVVRRVALAPRQHEQHRGQHRSADRRGRVGGDAPAAQRAEQGGPLGRDVARQVGRGDQAAPPGHVGDDLLGQVAGVEVGPPAAGDVGEGVGQLGRAQRRPRGVGGAPVGAVEGAGLLVPAEDRVVHEREVARRGRAEREAVTGGGDRGRQQLGPGRGAVALVRRGRRPRRLPAWPPSRGPRTP